MRTPSSNSPEEEVHTLDIREVWLTVAARIVNILSIQTIEAFIRRPAHIQCELLELHVQDHRRPAALFPPFPGWATTLQATATAAAATTFGVRCRLATPGNGGILVWRKYVFENPPAVFEVKMHAMLVHVVWLIVCQWRIRIDHKYASVSRVRAAFHSPHMR